MNLPSKSNTVSLMVHFNIIKLESNRHRLHGGTCPSILLNFKLVTQTVKLSGQDQLMCESLPVIQTQPLHFSRVFDESTALILLHNTGINNSYCYVSESYSSGIFHGVVSSKKSGAENFEQYYLLSKIVTIESNV